MDAVSLTLDHLSQRNEQVLFFMADAAADADHIGLKGIDDIRYAGCEIENILIDDFFRSLVACTHGIKRSSAVDAADVVTDEIPHGGIGIVAHGIFSLADKRGGGRIALPAASASAGAGFAVRDDDHMTHLARGIVDAGDELELDIKNGVLKDATKNIELKITPLPDVMIKLLNDGGLVEHLNKNGDFNLG